MWPDKDIVVATALLFVAGSGILDIENIHKWTVCIARYAVYLLTMEGVKSISTFIFDLVNNQVSLDLQIITKVNKSMVTMYVVGIIIVIHLNNQKLYMEDFPLIFIANLIVSYFTMAYTEIKKAAITYGIGMACSYVEGYLVHVIPSDGQEFGGFQENIKHIEAQQGVRFPVKKLFIICTKTMYCPPDLNEFNDKSDRNDVCRMEACQSLREIVKDVAGVKRRNYKNSTYKINRPNRRPVYIAAECATSIHTLYKVLKNRDLYDELADIDPDIVVKEFMETLAGILKKSPDLKNKCELIYFDDTNPDLNLPDVLLNRIRELEPKFEEFINRRD